MAIEGKRSRILTLDLLRGYFLLVILVDHARFFPSVFELITGRGEMWASAAEGFFIISGLLVGYVYGPRMVRNVLGTAKRMWKRAFLLYALTVLLTFLFVWWGNNSNILFVKEGLWTQPALGEFLYKTLTLQYYYGWADFLPYYALFMAWAPIALYAIIRGKAWAVLGISGALWLFRGGSFEMSWQILFMGSMVAGWYLPAIEAKARSLAPMVQKRLRTGLYAAAITLVVASVFTIRVGEVMVHEYAGFAALPVALQNVFMWLDSARDVMTPLIVKWTLEPVRLITALVWFTALYVWVRQHEAAINRLSRGFFRILGERSLVVYVVHSIVIFALLLVVPGDHGFWLNNLFTAAVVALVYGLAAGHARLARRSKRVATEGLRRLQLRNEDSL
ncbi:MAG TPA: OpgC domain-containing protein [Candidatus Saccharimonadales bacterium]|nr:OpgC domain-containing protein [Candidatus Saccharimonadales bacterium]